MACEACPGFRPTRHRIWCDNHGGGCHQRLNHPSCCFIIISSKVVGSRCFTCRPFRPRRLLGNSRVIRRYKPDWQSLFNSVKQSRFDTKERGVIMLKRTCVALLATTLIAMPAMARDKTLYLGVEAGPMWAGDLDMDF